jgi:L-fuconolactonase
MIIDTHVHAVSHDQRKYPRQLTSGAPGEWVRTMSAEMLLSLNEDAGIDRTVLVQPYSAYGYDNSYAADSASKYPGHFASVSILDPLLKDTPDNLSSWVKERGTRGLRLFTTTETEATWLDDPRTFPVWERAGSLGTPICIMALFHQIPRVRRVLEHFPTVTVALDHLALPRLSGGPPYDDAQPLFDLARFPNLYLKFSSINLYAASGGKSNAREFFSRLLESFGASRMMWGSNFPATNDRSLKEQYDLARYELSFASDSDQRRLFGETALGLWPMLR